MNYRTKELTWDAVRSGLSEPLVREVMIVDNGSADGSIEFFRVRAPAMNVRVIEAGENVGFGRAVNLAAKDAGGSLMLLLNSDATLLPGAVHALAAVISSDPHIGIAAPAVYEADGTTLQVGAYGRFPSLFEFGRSRRHASPGDLRPDWVSGVTMMMPMEVFIDAGGFDSDFEMYMEDVDLCRRVRGRGMEIVRVPSARVIHLGGRSWGSAAEKRDRFHRARLTYFRKVGAGRMTIAILQVRRVIRLALAALAARREGRPGRERLAGSDDGYRRRS